jgi:hypothetical protein
MVSVAGEVVEGMTDWCQSFVSAAGAVVALCSGNSEVLAYMVAAHVLERSPDAGVHLGVGQNRRYRDRAFRPLTSPCHLLRPLVAASFLGRQ